MEKVIEKKTFVKKHTGLSSEEVLVPPLVSNEELSERRETFTKTKAEREQLKKAKLNVDHALAAETFISYAQKNQFADSNFKIHID